MHPIVWFVMALCAAVLYGLRIRSVVGYVERPLMHWLVAVVMATSLAVGGILATRLSWQVPHDAGIAIHGVAMFVCVWLGLRYWICWKMWSLPAAALALMLVGLYYFQPQRYNNLVLVTMALGISVGGYYVTKKWLRVFYLLVGILDAYMVWGSGMSDAIEELARHQNGSFPSSLILGRLSLRFLDIGTLDVFLGAMAVVGILRHRGIRRALGFAAVTSAVPVVLVTVPELLLAHTKRFHSPSPWIGILVAVPFLVVLAPLVWLFLSGHKPAAPKRP